MPTTYTHDAFGKEAYERLPGPQKTLIRKYKKEYLAGLHGPDIFFYYKPYLVKKNKIVEFGHAMHKERAGTFFETGIEQYHETGSEALLAYLAGFVCHYILDSCCHPYVFAYQKKTGLSHGEIETNLDRYYMERDQKDPFTYHPASAICAVPETAEAIHLAFPQFTEKEILCSLKGMKFYCNLTVTRCEWKRRLFHRALKIAGADRGIGCRIIEQQPNPETAESTEELARLYRQALEEIVTAMGSLFEAVYEGTPLGSRFDRTYY